jgi:hypothetical protein
MMIYYLKQQLPDTIPAHQSVSAMACSFRRALSANPPEAQAAFEFLDPFSANPARQAPGG